MTTTRRFRFRLQSHHPGPEPSSNDLSVQWLNGEGRWEPQELSLTMPGFRLYLISLLLCQYVYLVANARERQIPLAGVQAEFTVTAAQDWILQSVIGDFRMQLHAAEGNATAPLVPESDLAYIQERMKGCPVSRNLQAGVEKITSVRLA